MKRKRWLSGLVAAAMLSTMTAGLPAVSAAETLPQPDYLFTFEQVADQVVHLDGSAGGGQEDDPAGGVRLGVL